MSTIRNRLTLVTGTWQVIVAVSAFKQAIDDGYPPSKDFLLLSGSQVSQMMKKNMMSLASVLWQWESIIWVDDLLHPKVPFPKIDRQSFDKLAREIRCRLAIKKFSELWLCKLTDPAEKILCEVYPEASIAIYEDGLHTYVPLEDWSLSLQELILNPKKSKKILFRTIQETKNRLAFITRYGLCKRHLKRLEKAYLVISNHIQAPSYLGNSIYHINSYHIHANIKAIRTSLKETISIVMLEDCRRVLVLGQCFSRWGKMSWSEEFEIYKNIFLFLSQKRLKILWKEHPRVHNSFYETLKTEVSSADAIELDIHFSWPIEIIIKDLNLLACISISSTSLFYIKDLFNIPTYTYSRNITSNFSGNFLYMMQLTKHCISPIEDIRF